MKCSILFVIMPSCKLAAAMTLIIKYSSNSTSFWFQSLRLATLKKIEMIRPETWQVYWFDDIMLCAKLSYAKSLIFWGDAVALWGPLWPFVALWQSMSRRPGDLNCHVNAWSLSYYVRHYVSIFWMLITRTHYRSHNARILYTLRAYIVYITRVYCICAFAVCCLPFAVCCMTYAVCSAI